MTDKPKDPLLTFLEKLIKIESAATAEVQSRRMGITYSPRVIHHALTSLINETVGHCSRVSDHCAKDLFDFLSKTAWADGFKVGGLELRLRMLTILNFDPEQD